MTGDLEQHHGLVVEVLDYFSGVCSPASRVLEQLLSVPVRPKDVMAFADRHDLPAICPAGRNPRLAQGDAPEEWLQRLRARHGLPENPGTSKSGTLSETYIETPMGTLRVTVELVASGSGPISSHVMREADVSSDPMVTLVRRNLDRLFSSGGSVNK